MNTLDIRKYQTPYKYGKPVIEGSGIAEQFDACSVDIPFVFFHKDQFYMMYTGFDGVGYQTALSVSDDLINWRFKDVILKRNDKDRWDSRSLAGTWILKESNNIEDLPRLKKVDGRYWMVYHSYPGEGYETGPAQIGLAYTEDEELINWTRLEEPIFSWKDGDLWERGGLYKACILWENDQYYLFYNAKDPGQHWIEQTGVAISKDMQTWERVETNPILKVGKGGWDWKFLSDPCIVKDGDIWLNFYFAYDLKHAQEGLASSTDLINWEKQPDPLISHGAVGDIDETHAHKASVVYHNDVLYHFYCAVRPAREGDIATVLGEYRTITVATSKSLNK